MPPLWFHEDPLRSAQIRFFLCSSCIWHRWRSALFHHTNTHNSSTTPLQDSGTRLTILTQLNTFRSMPSSLSSLNIHLIASPKVRAKSPELSISPTSESATFLPGSSPSFPPLPESPTARSRRSPSPSKTPNMNVFSTPLEHCLDVWLPTQILPEMVTVSAKKGSKLGIVADIWHQEKDSHYEWEITFPPRDVDMSSIRVDLANGHLTIHARRQQRRSSTV